MQTEKSGHRRVAYRAHLLFYVHVQKLISRDVERFIMTHLISFDLTFMLISSNSSIVSQVSATRRNGNYSSIVCAIFEISIIFSKV